MGRRQIAKETHETCPVFLSPNGWLVHKERWDRDFSEEIEAHLQLHTEDNMRSGMNEKEARRAAVLKLGGVEGAKAQYRDRRGFPWVEALLRDVRFAGRALRLNPGFTAIAALTLAIGIGAVTSVFSVVDTTLLRPLPYPQSNQIMTVARTSPRFDHPVPMSGADFLDWRSRSHTFSQMAAYSFANFTRTGEAAPEQISGNRVSASFCSVLGIKPELGRAFRPEEDQPGKNRVVILGQSLWKKWFDGRADIVGGSLLLDGEGYTIVGIMPPTFRFEEAPDSNLWVPLVLEPGIDRGNHWLRAIGRLATGISVKQAQAEMDVIAGQLQREHPHEDGDQGILILPFETRITNVNRDVVLIFFGAVLLVLLIACMNVGGLVLARSASRQKAFEMRAALGASRWRIVREVMVESVLLASIGGGAGVALSYILVPLIRAQKFIYLPRAGVIAVDGRILLFALGISILTGVIFGLAPAAQLARIDLNGVLKAGSGETALGGRWSLRSSLVVGEIALSLILLVAAGLLTRSLIRVLDTNPGYKTDHLLTFWLTLPQNRYRDDPAISQVSEEILAKVARVRGVRSAALTTALPPSGWEDDGGFLVLRHPATDMQHAPDTYIDAVSPGFFTTMGLSLIRGRPFNEQDNRPSAPKVVVISHVLAERYFRGENPIGQQMKFEEDDQKNAWTVVGVVSNTRFFGWDHDTGVFTYFPYKALGGRSHFAISVRTAGDPSSLSGVVKSAVWAIDRGLPLLDETTMQRRLDQAFAARRFNAALLAIFGAVALLLASIGLFGLLSHMVAQKTREIGVRMALGAKRQEIIWLIVKRALILTSIGIGIGLPCSLASALLLKSFLYGTKPYDVPVFLLATAALLGTTITAAFLPVRSASSVDPMKALRIS